MRFSKTILSSSIALGALLAVSGQAHAETQATIPSGSSSKTIDIGSINEWSGASTKYGSFGAGVDSSDTVSATTGDVLDETLSASAPIELFGKSLDLVGLSLKAENPNSGTIGVYLTETSFGAVVVNNIGVAIPASGSGNGSITGAVCASTTDLDVGETTIMVGPIPLYMAVSATVCPQLSGSGSTTPATGSSAALNWSIIPNLDVGVTAQIGIGTSVVSAGVKGSLSLLNVGLNITNTLNYYNSSRLMDYSTSGTLTISTLSGSFALYASAGWGPFSVEYDYTLFSWNGFSWNYSVFSDAKPKASDVAISISGPTVSGSYDYTGDTESGSSTWFERASSSSASSGTNIGSGTSYSLTSSENTQYLRFCVIPKSMSASGSQACSSWAPVGSLLRLYKDQNEGGTSKMYAYENSDSGTCFNLTDVSFNDALTSFIWQRPSIKPGSSTLVFYKDINCGGSTIDIPDSDVSGTTYQIDNIGTTYGSGWNDQVTSFRVFYNEVVTAENLAVSWSGPYAKPSYSFQDTSGVGESGSTFQWQRADDGAGTNATTVQSFSTTSQYALTTSDQDKFLRVCVIPSNGAVTGSQVCTDFIFVGKLLSLYKDQNYGGSILNFPYERFTSGTCVNLTDYSFNDAMTSYSVGSSPYSNPDNGFYGVTFYKDLSCSGSTMTSAFATGGGTNSSSYVGSTWNDQVTSFKATYRKVDAIDVTVTWSGAQAQPSYQYLQSQGLAESGSTYRWESADDIHGTNSHIVQNYGTNSAYNVAPPDQGKYLRVCIRPSDGVEVGPENCANWTWVGNLVSLFPNDNLGGTGVSFPYQHLASGTCYNLGTYGFNDVMNSLAAKYNSYTATSGNTYGVVLYHDNNCAGATYTSSWSTAGGTDTVNTLGAGFNDVASSIRIYFDN